MADPTNFHSLMPSVSPQGPGDSDDLPERLRFDLGEERLIRVTSDAMVQVFVHDLRYNAIPGLDISVRCQANCPLCAIGRVPACIALMPAVDLGTLAAGYLRVQLDLKRRDGVDLSLVPEQRHQLALQNSKFGTQVAKLCLFPTSPKVVTLRVQKLTEFKYLVLEATLPADMEPDPKVLADAAAVLSQVKDALREREATVVEATSLKSVPAILRALQLKGLA